MRGNGKMTCNMGVGLRSGLMEALIWDSIFMGRNREWDCISGVMGLSIRESGMKTKYMA